ncbi:hypothetical protein KR009_008895, partial [Drosophila setifemur]
VARCIIVANFVADAVNTWRNWHLELSILTMRLRGCGWKVAGVYLILMAAAQLGASVLLVAKQRRFLATGVLCLAAHLRMAANRALWGLSTYFNLCSLLSVLLMSMLEPRRQAIVTFLLITYLSCHDTQCPLWNLLYKYILKLLIAFLMVGFRMKTSALVLILFLIAHCLYAYAYWRVPIAHNTLALRDLKRFQLWNKVSVMGGLLL